MKKYIPLFLLLFALLSCKSTTPAETNTPCPVCGQEVTSSTDTYCQACMVWHVDEVVSICKTDTSRNPIEVLEHLMSQDFCPMHGPLHHVLVGASLLTAYHNAGGEVELEAALHTLIRRGMDIPGGACGNWGACGASLSAGIFMSIVTDNSPFATESWHLSNLLTAKALEQVANNGGPRCCKRDSYLSILATIDFVKEHLGVEMEKPVVKCSRSQINQQCIGQKCPFSGK
ncbi:MAG: DUF5714 domain-containing protein [Bacteroidales bacterium]|nr:DUF5714 domain-containing protein [Bacteroidales bacterium]